MAENPSAPTRALVPAALTYSKVPGLLRTGHGNSGALFGRQTGEQADGQTKSKA